MAAEGGSQVLGVGGRPLNSRAAPRGIDYTQCLAPRLQSSQFKIAIESTWWGRHQDIWPSGLREANGDKSDSLQVVFLDLEDGIEENLTPNYADIEVLGRAENFKVFVGAQNKEIPLRLRFWAQGRATSPNRITDIIKQEVLVPVRWIEQLKKPLVDDRKDPPLSIAPPPVILTVGRLLAARCIVSDASVRWMGPFTTDDVLPSGAEVDITFTVTRDLIKRTGAFASQVDT